MRCNATVGTGTNLRDGEARVHHPARPLNNVCRHFLCRELLRKVLLEEPELKAVPLQARARAQGQLSAQGAEEGALARTIGPPHNHTVPLAEGEACPPHDRLSAPPKCSILQLELLKGTWWWVWEVQLRSESLHALRRRNLLRLELLDHLHTRLGLRTARSR